MKILMFTNTFTPRLGGVTQSIGSLRQELIKRGHAILIVTVKPPGDVLWETGVLRVPALVHTHGADWPLPIISKRVRQEIQAFGPDIIHAHHPFLLGRTALHTAARFDVPIVYTFHTRYDLYLRALGGGILPEKLIHRSVMAFCQTADAVITPSETIRCILQASGLMTPLVTIPSGVDEARVPRHAKIFAERFPPAVARQHVRRTSRLQGLVRHLGLALGGRPAQALSRRLLLPVNRLKTLHYNVRCMAVPTSICSGRGSLQKPDQERPNLHQN